MPARTRSVCALAIGCFLLARGASALTQPDGTPIPVPKSNASEDLQSIFNAQGETIQVMADAAIVPETFDPTCNLTFTMISRGGASFQNMFGWYNVTGAAPANTELHVLIGCTAQPPQAFPLQIKGDPNYKGGKIGFFMVTPEGTGTNCPFNTIGHVYYSEKQWNPDNTGPNSYIHLLIYDSKKQKSSFYFAWEDLYGGGDNEFTDLVTRVDGISCAGGGAPCDTGKKGICAAGTMQCQNGMLTCVQQSMPGAATCNGLDNDCNGTVDTNCTGANVCDKGQCVAKCGTGEFQCGGATTCSADGFCIDSKCAGVTCSAGKVCVDGACAGPCDGVVCPHGTICTAAGACVDQCAGVTCGTQQICQAGACIDKCGCAGCAAGNACLPSGACVPMACATTTCPAGQFCGADGKCADACAGAKCPGGGVCTAGVCGPPKAGAGGAGGSGATTGTGGMSSLIGAGGVGAGGNVGGLVGGGTGKGGKGVGGGTTAKGGAAGSLIANDAPADPAVGGGCGCRTTGGERGGVFALLLAIPLLVRRRRRLLQFPLQCRMGRTGEPARRQGRQEQQAIALACCTAAAARASRTRRATASAVGASVPAPGRTILSATRR